MAEETQSDVLTLWAKVKDGNEWKEAVKVTEGAPSTPWTQARTQMLAMQGRSLKRAKADEDRRKEKEASLMVIRKQAEEDSKKLVQESKAKRDEDAKRRDEMLAEARRKEKERLEIMAATVVPDEAWDVFS